MVERHDIEMAYAGLIGAGRIPDELLGRLTTLPDLAAVVAAIMDTAAYRAEYAAGRVASASVARHFGTRGKAPVMLRPDPYLAPRALEVGDDGPRRVLLLGGCFMLEWPDYLGKAGVTTGFDRLLFWNAANPPEPPLPPEDYDLQVVQVPLPAIVPEIEFIRLPYADVVAYETFFADCIGRLELFLSLALRLHDRVLTFVPGYICPQQNLIGRLGPRHDLRNPIHFIERLNMEVERIARGVSNCHYLDADHIVSVSGRRFYQQDFVASQYHGGFIDPALDRALDANKRLERSPPLRTLYDLAPELAITSIWQEIRAAWRTIRGIDAVKMVCVDLDDTLWRGVIGEMELDETSDTNLMILGWPVALAEVLMYLKKRGIILAIVSKNDEARVRRLWDTILAGWLRIEDFAIVKINWRPKAENVAEAIAEANLLPRSVVFLDDNPVERAAVTAALPEVRAIGGSHYEWRRILGWSAELQVAAISDESARRTELIQAQVVRERSRATLTREEFLSSLDLAIDIAPVRDGGDRRYARAFELINKTNQFNTTGRRWTQAEAIDYLTGGGVWWTFSAADRLTRYGLVGVACIRDGCVDQFVMSCRVAGLDLEQAALTAIFALAAPDRPLLSGRMQATDANAVVRDLFEQFGWTRDDGLWRGPPPQRVFAHVAVNRAAAREPG